MKRCLPDKYRFGHQEKRWGQLMLICTPEEKQLWKRAFGPFIASQVRTLLDIAASEVTATNKNLIRPEFKLLTARVRIRCSPTELWYWQMVSPFRGNLSMLGRIACILLNKEALRRHDHNQDKPLCPICNALRW